MKYYEGNEVVLSKKLQIPPTFLSHAYVQLVNASSAYIQLPLLRPFMTE